MSLTMERSFLSVFGGSRVHIIRFSYNIKLKILLFRIPFHKWSTKIGNQ